MLRLSLPGLKRRLRRSTISGALVHTTSRCGSCRRLFDVYRSAERLKEEGIRAVEKFDHLVLVPALAPMNCRTDGATEMAWSTFLAHPIALVFSSTTAAFATFASSVSPAAARVQQMMRTVGKLQFVVAAAPSGPACGTMQDLVPLVPCSMCRATLRSAGEAVSLDDATLRKLTASCKKCDARHERLQLFLDLPCSLLRTVLIHHDKGCAEAAEQARCYWRRRGRDGACTAGATAQWHDCCWNATS